jgi:hypothetical protein
MLVVCQDDFSDMAEVLPKISRFEVVSIEFFNFHQVFRCLWVIFDLGSLLP